MSKLAYNELRRIIDTIDINTVEIVTETGNNKYKFDDAGVMCDDEELDIYTDKQDYTIKMKGIQAVKNIRDVLKLRIENVCQIEGLFMGSLDKTVKAYGNGSMVLVPKNWAGKRVKVVLLEPL